MKLRAPSVPLIAIDPYFSVWSPADQLTDTTTKHWSGKQNTITGTLYIDGVGYRFMDDDYTPCDNMEQISLEWTAMTTTYLFQAAGIQLTVRFFSPVFADDLLLLSRPVSFMELTAISVDGQEHSLRAEVQVSEEICLNLPRELPVDMQEVSMPGDLATIRMGSKKQAVLGRSGDDLRMDWGYFYLSVPGGKVSCLDDDWRNSCYLLASAELSIGVSQLFSFAYDDICSIEYFGKHLAAFWRQGGRTIESAIADAFAEYSELIVRETVFSTDLRERAVRAGGEKYAELLLLAYRQVMAGHKLVVDEEDGLLYISKECFSNGCAATVDVSYPSMPLFLLYNTELLRGMLRPICRYAASEAWPHDYAPHDVGTYPLVNGQVYSNGTDPDNQMPVEECGNMLIMTAAAARMDGDLSLFAQYEELFRAWAEYLIAQGVDLGDQLSSDDFMGHMSHSCNLSLKSIMGIASMSLLLEMRGCAEEAVQYRTTAREMARTWVEMAVEDDGGSRLAFDQPGTFSLKYNMVWDKLLDTGLFTRAEMEAEFRSYAQYRNTYGVPLDSRGTSSKTDWLTWVGAMAPSPEEFADFISPIWQYYHETRNRTPMSDWYSTVTAKRFFSQHRTVQGGLYIALLLDR